MGKNKYRLKNIYKYYWFISLNKWVKMYSLEICSSLCRKTTKVSWSVTSNILVSCQRISIINEGVRVVPAVRAALMRDASVIRCQRVHLSRWRQSPVKTWRKLQTALNSALFFFDLYIYLLTLPAVVAGVPSEKAAVKTLTWVKVKTLC